jgi:hypothetical protein
VGGVAVSVGVGTCAALDGAAEVLAWVDGPGDSVGASPVPWPQAARARTIAMTGARPAVPLDRDTLIPLTPIVDDTPSG